jgi:hypothetical protein
MAAFGCIRTLNALLDSVSTLTELLPQLEDALFPIMFEMTSSRGQDVFEEVMDMASYFTYFMDPLPQRLWTLWPRIHESLMEWAIDYWDNILPPLDNLISRDTATFLGSSNPNYQESVFQVGAGSLLGVRVEGQLGQGGDPDFQASAVSQKAYKMESELALGCTHWWVPRQSIPCFQCAPPPAHVPLPGWRLQRH